MRENRNLDRDHLDNCICHYFLFYIFIQPQLLKNIVVVLKNIVVVLRQFGLENVLIFKYIISQNIHSNGYKFESCLYYSHIAFVFRVNFKHHLCATKRPQSSKTLGLVWFVSFLFLRKCLESDREFLLCSQLFQLRRLVCHFLILYCFKTFV